MWLRGGFVSGAICCFVFCVWGVAQGGEEREEQLEIDCVSILKGFSPVRGCDRIFFPVSCCPLIRTHRALEARQKPKHGGWHTHSSSSSSQKPRTFHVMPYASGEYHPK